LVAQRGAAITRPHASIRRAWGGRGGAGLDFFFDDGGVALSVNVQYIRINNTQVDMEIMPINVGYKVMF
jgi:hypothetical protein